jgi:hypothetical protein
VRETVGEKECERETATPARWVAAAVLNEGEVATGGQGHLQGRSGVTPSELLHRPVSPSCFSTARDEQPWRDEVGSVSPSSSPSEAAPPRVEHRR